MDQNNFNRTRKQNELEKRKKEKEKIMSLLDQLNNNSACDSFVHVSHKANCVVYQVFRENLLFTCIENEKLNYIQTI